MRVLIVEDEPDLASALQRLLEDAGFSADVAGDGETGLALALEDTYDLLVLDLMLPRLPGEKVVAELRRRGRDLPVLVLTARDLVPDRVRLLDSGADDYVIKPFEPEELVSRCRALVRRASGQASPRLELGDVTIDLARREVRRGGEPVAVTPREFRVLEYLALNRGRVVSREELLSRLYGENEETWSNVLEVYVAALRRKLGPAIIATRRGHGYIVE
ncbi:MAG TPA: response regulator transcription factor [Vicinamibacterales bacterium]